MGPGECPFWVIAILAVTLAFCGRSVAAWQSLSLERITLPPGFRISVYAEVPGARSLALLLGGWHLSLLVLTMGEVLLY